MNMPKMNIVKLIILIIIVSVFLCTVTGCGEETETAYPSVEVSSIGAMTGSTGEAFARKNFLDADIYAYDSIPDAVVALQADRIDYVITAYTNALGFIRNNKDLEIVPGTLLNEGAAIAVNKNNPGLLKDISAVLDRFKEDGTLDDIIDRWIKEDGSEYQRMEIPVNQTGEVLSVGVAANREPMCFIENGNVIGLDAELIERIAYELGKRVEFMDMTFSALIPALESGRVDVLISNITPTEERKQVVNFTDTYFQNPQVLLRRVDTGVLSEQSDNLSFLENLKVSIERNLIHENRWMMVLEGLQVSLIITISAFTLATVAGFGVCGLRMSRNRILKSIGSIYINVLRGTPIVVLLMITFYIIFAGTSVSSIIVATIAFGANGAAFIGEIIRSAILTVDKGQVEAARSMGFSKIGAFFTVTFPQAVRVALPVYKSEFVSLFKMTSVVGYIAIVDLTKAGDIIRSRTYDAFFPLIMVALIYLIIATLMIFLFDYINNATDKRSRSKRKNAKSIKASGKEVVV